MADSILGQILEATLTDLRDNVALTGIENEHIFIQPIPDDVENAPVSLPFITVSSFRAESFPNPGTNVSDDYGYPVSIFILDSAEKLVNNFKALDQRFLWRENILDRFIRNKFTIAAAGTVQYDIIIEPSPIVDPLAWLNRSLFVSPINLRVVTRVTRRT